MSSVDDQEGSGPGRDPSKEWLKASGELSQIICWFSFTIGYRYRGALMKLLGSPDDQFHPEDSRTGDRDRFLDRLSIATIIIKQHKQSSQLAKLEKNSSIHRASFRL